MTPLERLKTHLALAQAAVVLYTLGRQLDAAKLDNHPIQKELVSDDCARQWQHVGPALRLRTLYAQQH